MWLPSTWNMAEELNITLNLKFPHVPSGYWIEYHTNKGQQDMRKHEWKIMLYLEEQNKDTRKANS